MCWQLRWHACCHLSGCGVWPGCDVVGHQEHSTKAANHSRYQIVIESRYAQREAEHRKICIAVLTCGCYMMTFARLRMQLIVP